MGLTRMMLRLEHGKKECQTYSLAHGGHALNGSFPVPLRDNIRIARSKIFKGVIPLSFHRLSI